MSAETTILVALQDASIRSDYETMRALMQRGAELQKIAVERGEVFKARESLLFHMDSKGRDGRQMKHLCLRFHAPPIGEIYVAVTSDGGVAGSKPFFTFWDSHKLVTVENDFENVTFLRTKNHTLVSLLNNGDSLAKAQSHLTVYDPKQLLTNWEFFKSPQ